MFEKLKAFLMGYKKLSEGESKEKIEKMSDAEKTDMAMDADAHEAMKKHLMDNEKLSAEDADKKLAAMSDEDKEKVIDKMSADKDADDAKKEKMKKHLMDEKKMSEDEANAALASMKDEDKASLASEIEEKEKKLAAETNENTEKKLTAKKEAITKLKAGIETSKKKVELAAKQNKIIIRLNALKAKGKITPAEIKKIGLSEFATKGDDVVDEVLKSFEEREPVIMPGVYGSLKGSDLSSIGAELRMSKLEAETRLNMPSKRAEIERLAKKARLAEGGEEEGSPDTVNVHIDTDPHTDLASYDDACKMLDEGKNDEVKSHMKKMYDKMKSMSEGKAGDSLSAEVEKNNSELAEEMKLMQNQVEELIKLSQE